MLTRLVVIIVIAGIVYIGFEWGVVYTINHDIKTKEENYKELTDEIDWWKKQTKEALNEVNEWKGKRNEMQHKYNKERNKVFELEKNLEAYMKGRGKRKKKTIAEKNGENIVALFNEGLSDYGIAKILGCSKSTVQRAIKKWGLR